MPGSQRVAAIDIGTNSVLLVIAAAEPDGPRPLLERATITRMGEGVDQTRRLAPAAVERNLRCLRDYAEDLRAHGAPRLDVVGTSALRDAEGAQEFLDEAERILGVRPRVIAGDEEARLTFRGAQSGLSLSGKLLVFDIGGGSTELILGDALGLAPAESRVSLDIGSVRLFERLVQSDPPRAEELSRIDAQIGQALADAAPLAQLEGSEAVTLLGVAGTVTTLKSLELEMPVYDAARVHGSRLSLAAVDELCAKLASLPLAERVKLPGLSPKRADVIVVGARIVRELLRRAGAKETFVSDRGVRFGLLEALISA